MSPFRMALLLALVTLPRLAHATLLIIDPIPLAALVEQAPIIVEVVVADPPTTLRAVPLEDSACPSMNRTWYEFEVVAVLKGGADAPSGKGHAVGANDALTRAMALGMCRGDPVPSPIVQGFEPAVEWETGARLLVFLAASPEDGWRLQVQRSFESVAKKDEVEKLLAAPSD